MQHPCLCNICLKARDDEIRRVRESRPTSTERNAVLETALKKIISIKGDRLGPRDGSEGEMTDTFDRVARMAFYRCAAIAEKALSQSPPPRMVEEK